MPKVFSILTGFDNPVLRKKSAKIVKIDQKIKKLADLMQEVMDEAKGVGLAAPQVGQNIRLIIIRYYLAEERTKKLVLINPEIVALSKTEIVREEGCLSLPNVWEKIARPRWVQVKFQDLKGNLQIWKMEDLNARVVSHEIDHLEGILFVDRLEIFEAANIKKREALKS